jgi:UDP-N-acetylglucosamine 2-epimerase (non-hydrolysing)
MKYVLVAFGTRPEAIKLAPVIKEFAKHPDKFAVKVCITSQHKEMLTQVMNFFNLKYDYDLHVMVQNQSLYHITSAVLLRMGEVFQREHFDVVIVQGDTTTTFGSSLAAFYERVKVGHVEAGLRTFNKYSPFPEEINRKLTTSLADYHFAPTRSSFENLIKEGVDKESVHLTGNTVIDALLMGIRQLDGYSEEQQEALLRTTKLKKGVVDRIVHGDISKLITVTAHRRESFGDPFEQICLAMKDIIEADKDVEIVYPVHLNPGVREIVFRAMGNVPRIHLIEPLQYEQLIYLMNRSYLILTDSGGIQEEAPSLRKPVLVMREVTERPEGVEAGVSKLVGTDRNRIADTVLELLDSGSSYDKMVTGVNPYGDGKASQRIVDVLIESV